jgi:ubiquinone/menaquinone biosynthesis C-methylase UbiE
VTRREATAVYRGIRECGHSSDPIREDVISSRDVKPWPQERGRLFFKRTVQAGKSIFTLNRDREFAELKRMLDLKSTDHLLDAGCGDGFWTSRVAKICGYVTGLEPDNRTIKYARALHSRPNITYVCGVAESLPFEDSTFDKVLSISCLEHFADPWRGIAEMARVLKPGGRIALSVDSLLPENSTQSFREWHKRRHFVTHYFSQDTLTTALRNAGFRNGAEPIVHLFRSQAAARLRQNFIQSPRLWLPFFPAFYLAARFTDHVFNDTHGQIIIVTASR